MIVTKIERRIQHLKSETGERRFHLKVHPDTAAFLSEGFNSRVRQFMMKYLVVIKVVKDDAQKEEDFVLLSAKEHNKEKRGWKRFFGLTS
jgi:hypothetical protein